MSALSLTLIQLGFLAVLWLFVLIAVSVMRSDLFGVRGVRVSRGAAASTAKPVAPKPPKAPKASRSKRGTPGTVVIIDGAGTGTSVPLGLEDVTVGRGADNTLVLTDDYASSHHARFYVRNNAWHVEDLGSTNGTHIGPNRLTAPAEVAVGTAVRMGKTVIEVRK